MHRGIPLHMTSRNKRLLEDVVSRLWELESARRTQERLVLGVLAPGDTETLKWQQKQLPDAPGGVMAVLQQQLSELTMDSNTENSLDSVSGFYKQTEIHTSLRQSRSSPSLSFYNHRGRTADDAHMLDWEGQRARPLRAFLPRSFSAPYPPLEGIAEGIEEAEDDDNGTHLSESQTPDGEDTNGPDMAPIMNEAGDPNGIHCDYQGPTVEVDAGPTVEDIQQAMRVETYILGLLQRYCLSQTLASTQDLSSTPDCWQEPPDYPTYHSEQPDNAEWQDWDLFNNEKASQDRYYLEVEADRFSQACEDPGFSLDASTIVADIDSHCHYHPCISPPLLFESPKQDWEPTCLKMAHHVPIARLYQEEHWSSVSATSQPQSEGSFCPQGLTTKLEHGYHTLGQDLDAPCFNKDYLSSRRLWSSSTDFSQEESEKLLRTEEHLFQQPFHINSHSGPKHTGKDPLIGNEMNAGGTQLDGSDSSLSETCSPGSSSTSCDSDESGGLVWPQQVPPFVPSFSQNAPTAMVKIKASHALKKKILRFRSGSLKVMTTV